MSSVEIMIQKDKPQGIPDKKRKTIVNQNSQGQPTPAPRSAMTIPMSAKRPNHNKWDAVMSKMAETKHRPINVKDVKSKVFINTKVNVIPSHPSSAHRVQEKEQQDPAAAIIKIMNSNNKRGNERLTTRVKPDRNRLPKLLKETYSSQSSTLSSSSEEHSHQTRRSRLVNQSSSTSCTSTGTVIPSSRSPSIPTTNKSILRNKSPESNNKAPRGTSNGPDIQSLRTELVRERESKERTVQENKTLRIELKNLLEAQSVACHGKQALEVELSAAERRLKDARSDWEREREHAWEETEATSRLHALELQNLSKAHQADLYALKESHEAEFDLLKSSYKTDLNQLRASFEFRELDNEQKHEFEIEELKAKHLEELENLESHYKVEIELLQHKLKGYSSYGGGHAPSSKESTTDLLHKEITSLSVVVELRNNEIKDLRQEVMSQRLELERVQGVDDQNMMLIQKVEDLEAQVQKTRDDKKKLIVENQTMQTSMHEAVTAKEKLSMELDYLRYRIEESTDSGVVNDSPKNNHQSF